jgi:transposase
MEPKYIGFDIDSKKTVACVVQEGQRNVYQTLPTDIVQMQQYLRQQGRDGSPLHLTFEISGEAGYRYDALRPCVQSLTVSNPSKMTWIFRTSRKNDRIDARKQAVLLSIREIPKVHMPVLEVRQWRRAIQHRRLLVGRSTAIKNQIRALLKAHNLKPSEPGSWWKRANRHWMEQLGRDWSEVGRESLWRVQLKNLLEELVLLGGQFKEVTSYLDAYLDRHPGATLLLSIPGIGPRTAEAVLAYTDDIWRFKRSRQYCAYFGLTPKLDESGRCRRLGHISKEGPSVVRWLLVESAWRVIARCPAMKAFYERVQGGHADRRKVAVVAVARKLLCIMRAMLQTGALFNASLVGSAPAVA